LNLNALPAILALAMESIKLKTHVGDDGLLHLPYL
jgi:hypothetical protein